MRDRLEIALDEFGAAIQSGSADAICRASRVVYALAVEAAHTFNGRWGGLAPRVRELFTLALSTPQLVGDPDARHADNVRQRLEELSPYLAGDSGVTARAGAADRGPSAAT